MTVLDLAKGEYGNARLQDVLYGLTGWGTIRVGKASEIKNFPSQVGFKKFSQTMPYKTMGQSKKQNITEDIQMNREAVIRPIRLKCLDCAGLDSRDTWIFTQPVDLCNSSMCPLNRKVVIKD